MPSIKRILLTPGEPAGIGPDIVLAIAQQPWAVELVVIADPDLLIGRAKQLNIPIELLPFELGARAQTHQPQTLKILPIKMPATCEVGELNPLNAHYVMKTLEQAANLVTQQQADAIVTGPVQKSVLNAANIPFSGHTEFFANFAKVDKTVMLFVVDQLKVALATTHVPLSEVSQHITPASLTATIKILTQGLQQHFGITTPHILVCGLNPHAGENGYLGKEEITTITPTLNILRQQGLAITGPIPADTAFTPLLTQQADVILAMYHDQALPVVKHIGFDRAVNMTLGLPFIRTSVDHGTALSLAGTGRADSGSIHAALSLAIKLCHASSQPLLTV